MSFGENTFASDIECILNKPSSHLKEIQKYSGMITWFIYIYLYTHSGDYFFHYIFLDIEKKI